MPRKITKAVIDHAQDLITNGSLLIEAARIVKCHPDTLSQYLRAGGFKIPKGGRPAHNRVFLPINDLISDYISGGTEPSLSAKYGVARQTIRKRLIASGIKLRSVSEGNKIRMG